MSWKTCKFHFLKIQLVENFEPVTVTTRTLCHMWTRWQWPQEPCATCELGDSEYKNPVPHVNSVTVTTRTLCHMWTRWQWTQEHCATVKVKTITVTVDTRTLCHCYCEPRNTVPLLLWTQEHCATVTVNTRTLCHCYCEHKNTVTVHAPYMLSSSILYSMMASTTPCFTRVPRAHWSVSEGSDSSSTSTVSFSGTRENK